MKNIKTGILKSLKTLMLIAVFMLVNMQISNAKVSVT